ncbi:MAG: plasmid pRiA4b ORF-3 family protein [Armatimonadota bacterium]
MAKKPEEKAYQLKITLLGLDPPIWRRVQVTGDTTLGDMHQIIQAVMDWEDCHLHEFDVRGDRFSDGRFGLGDMFGDVGDEDEVYLADLNIRKGSKFKYTYDFGDDWEHLIEVEATIDRDPETAYPVYVDGDYAAPPEDVGGAWSYAGMVIALQDESDPEHERWNEFFSGWDPYLIDEDGIRARLERI